MTRYQPQTIKQRGQVAKAMAAVYAQKPQNGEAKGRIQCPACNGALNFTVNSTGLSRGHCGCGMRWCQ
ncbi:MAG: hypothetical protein KF686_03620 [Ramlibacter sp.]|nr:hypothetical protein [Ramlibacter sp.]